MKEYVYTVRYSFNIQLKTMNNASIRQIFCTIELHIRKLILLFFLFFVIFLSINLLIKQKNGFEV